MKKQGGGFFCKSRFLCLEKGADIYLGEGNSATMTAAKKGHKDIVHLLLDLGEDINEVNPSRHTITYAAADLGMWFEQPKQLR